MPRISQSAWSSPASAEFKTVAARIDAPIMYLDGPDYKKYVAEVYSQETQLIQRLKLKEMLAQS